MSLHSEIEVDWLDSGARTFWAIVALILFVLMLWWSALGPLFGFEHHPMRACISGIIFFVVGMCISVADDGGLGEEFG